MNDLVENKRIISLYDICKILNVRHTNSKIKVEKLHKEPSFEEVLKTSTLNNNNVKVETYSYTKKQAIVIGAKLNDKLLMELINKLEELNKPKKLTVQDVIEMKPKANFVDKVFDTYKGCIRLGDFVKAYNHKDMGRNKFFNYLRVNHYLSIDNMPLQRYINQGLFEVKEITYRNDGKQDLSFITLLTPRGQKYFTSKLDKIVSKV